MNTKEMQHPASDEPPSPPFPGSDVTTKKRGLYTLPFLNGISTTDLGFMVPQVVRTGPNCISMGAWGGGGVRLRSS